MVRWSSRNNNNNSGGAELTTTLTFIMGCRIRPSSYNNNTSTRNQDKCSGCPRLCCFMNISCQLARQREYGVRAEADLLQLPGGRLRGPGIRTRQEDLRGLLPLQTGVSRPALRIRRPAESCRKDDSSLSLYDGDDA